MPLGFTALNFYKVANFGHIDFCVTYRLQLALFCLYRLALGTVSRQQGIPRGTLSVLKRWVYLFCNLFQFNLSFHENKLRRLG